MAYTNAILWTANFANKRVVYVSMSADANSGVVATGLSIVEGISAVVISAATTSQNFKLNKNASGTATPGSIMVSSCTNGDVMHLTVYGH